jgi:hypothetical protein
MDEKVREQLRKRFDFKAWKSAPRGVAKVSTGGLIEVGSALGSWTAIRAAPISVPGARAAHLSMWQQGASSEALLRLDLVDGASATAAREMVLELLGQFESPQIQRLPNPPAGDLAFGAPGNTVIVFSRGNVVAMVRNAGRRVVPVTEFARLVDGRLASGSRPSRR